MGVNTAPAWRARHHVLIVEVPGETDLRMRTEAAAVTRGDQIVDHPAAADLLLVCGHPGDQLASAIDQVWEQIPLPRARRTITDPASISAALAAPLDTPAPRGDGTESAWMGHHDLHPDAMHMSTTDMIRTDTGHGATSDSKDARPPGHGQQDMVGDQRMESRTDSRDMNDRTDMSGHDHGDMSAHDHGDMSGHEHGDMDMDMDMDMSGPGGVALASGAADRDGLEMDVLHRRLGPVLTCWPAGFVLEVTLAGDTITAAAAHTIDAGPRSPSPVSPATSLDGAARILALAGWDPAAHRALRARDAVLDGRNRQAQQLLTPLRRQVRRSSALRWAIGRIPVTHGRSVLDVLHARLAWAAALLAGAVPQPEPGTPLHLVPARVVGRDLGTARLIIAALRLAPPDHADADRFAMHQDANG